MELFKVNVVAFSSVNKPKCSRKLMANFSPLILNLSLSYIQSLFICLHTHFLFLIMD